MSAPAQWCSFGRAWPRLLIARLQLPIWLASNSKSYEAGDVLLEQRVSTTPKAIKEIFGVMPRSRIALETGTHSPWVSRLLSELGQESIVAHARSVRLIGESRRKDDLRKDDSRARYHSV